MLSGPLIWGGEQQLGAASLSRQQAQTTQSLLYWASNGAGVSSLGIDAPCMAQPLRLSEHQRQKLGNRARTLPCPHFFPYSLPATRKPATSSHPPCCVCLGTFAPLLPLEFSYPNQLQLEGYGYRCLRHCLRGVLLDDHFKNLAPLTPTEPL